MARSDANSIAFLRCKSCRFKRRSRGHAAGRRSPLSPSNFFGWLTFELIGNVLYRNVCSASINFVECWVQIPGAKPSDMVLRSGRMTAIVRRQRHKKENNLDSTISKDSSGVRSGWSTLVFCSYTAGAGRRRQRQMPACGRKSGSETRPSDPKGRRARPRSRGAATGLERGTAALLG
jgi:hypothetical protein